MAFSLGATGLSHLPSCFESIFGVTVESVQGSQVSLEWIGTSGSFGMVTRPLEFLSSFNLRLPPPAMPQECQDSFLDEAGKGSSSREEEGISELFLSCGGTLSVSLKWTQVCRGTS